MVKNYTVTFSTIIYALLFLGMVNFVQSQEIKIFTSADFDLKGPVKSCLVSTKYGKESYEFNKDGLLIKSVTQYNDEDYDVTYYKYKESELIEKRFENYRNNVFESSTSYANFYELDTIPVRKITEKIISYDKEFLDRYEYYYNAGNILVKIMRTNTEGNDETLIEYTDHKGEKTQTNSLNGMILKSVRKSDKTNKDKGKQQLILTKRFLNGEPQSAVEAVYNENDKLVAETKFEQNLKKGQFAPTETIVYEYDDKGLLLKTTTKANNKVAVKEFVYQFDNAEDGNWIKEIITPENSYTTRKIVYYGIAHETTPEE